MAESPEEPVAEHAAAQFGTGQTAAGDDQLVHKESFFRTFHPEAAILLFHLRHFKSGQKLDIFLFQRKPQNIHHGICLVRIGIHTSGILCHRVKPHLREPFQGLFHIKCLQGRLCKGGIIAMVAALQRMEIRQIASAVSRSAELLAHSLLPLHQNYLYIRVFRRGQCRRHTGSTGTNNSNYHKFTCFP